MVFEKRNILVNFILPVLLIVFFTFSSAAEIKIIELHNATIDDLLNSSIGKVLKIDRDWNLVIIKTNGNRTLSIGDKVFINNHELFVGAVGKNNQLSLLDDKKNLSQIIETYKPGDLVHDSLKPKKETLKTKTVYCRSVDGLKVFERTTGCYSLESRISKVEYDARVKASPKIIELFPDDDSTVTSVAAKKLSADEQFQIAFDLLRSQKFDQAKKALEEFIDNNSKNQLAGSAYYWLGEIHSIKKNYREAALIFAEGYQKHPRNIKAPESLYKLAVALLEIDKINDACNTLKKFIKEYSKNRYINRAKNNFDNYCDNNNNTITASSDQDSSITDFTDSLFMEISGSGVRIRNKPSAKNSNIIISLSKGTVVEVIGENKHGWYKIVIPGSNRVGYVSSDYVRDVINSNGDIMIAAKKDLESLKKKIASNKKSASKKTSPKKPKDRTSKVEKKPEQSSVDVQEDKEGPIIDISRTIQAKGMTAEIKGRVEDASEIRLVTVDGDPIKFENGQFNKPLFVPEDGQKVEIVAIDKHANSTKIEITVLHEAIEEVLTFEKLNPLSINGKVKKDAVAIIIGVEKYPKTHPASFARNDALTFKGFANKTLGIPLKNIKTLTNEEANRVDTKKAFVQWLPNKVVPDKTDVYLFYAGHGLATSDGKDLYLIPNDGDPDLLEFSSLRRKEIFKDIDRLNPRTATLFLDTCYSGVTRSNEPLRDTRQLTIEIEEQEIPNNFTIFAASANDQFASSLDQAKHGLFSYFMMKGLEGEADENKNQRITIDELYAYLSNKVQIQASSFGRKQTPQLHGDGSQVLVEW